MECRLDVEGGILDQPDVVGFDELKCFWKPDVVALMGLLINDLVRAPKGAVTVQTPGRFSGCRL